MCDEALHKLIIWVPLFVLVLGIGLVAFIAWAIY